MSPPEEYRGFILYIKLHGKLSHIGCSQSLTKAYNKKKVVVLSWDDGTYLIWKQGKYKCKSLTC